MNKKSLKYNVQIQAVIKNNALYRGTVIRYLVGLILLFLSRLQNNKNWIP